MWKILKTDTLWGVKGGQYNNVLSKAVGQFFKCPNIQLPYDSAIPFLDIQPKKNEKICAHKC